MSCSHWRFWSRVLLKGIRPASYGEPWKEFSGEKALAHVQALVDFGPRPPAPRRSRRPATYLRQYLEANGWQVVEQPFTDETPRGPVEFVNLIARRPNEASKLFLLGSHYDTKTFDSIRFLGANDGGSSSGALLELARVLNLHPKMAAQIELVFFDGEEAYERFTASDGLLRQPLLCPQTQKADHVKIIAAGSSGT